VKFKIIIFFIALLSLPILAKNQNTVIIGKITCLGNNTTKKSIILRELLFKEGDTIKFSDWKIIKEQSTNNLINTLLFHTALIDFANDSVSAKEIKIKVIERWYFWPAPILDIDERNFNVWWQSKSLSRASAGINITKQNFRGRMEKLKINVMAGYNQKIGFSYDAPYLNKKKTFGYGAEAIWTLKHEVNYAIENDIQVYLKQTIPVQKDLLTAIHFRYRPDYYVSYLLQFRFQKYYFSDSLIAKNPNYGDGNSKEFSFLSAYYKLKIDHRDFRPYPLEGYYSDFEIWKYGFGMMENSNLNIWYAKSNYRKYWSISNRWYAAVGFVGKVSNSTNQPYLLEDGLGYGRDFVRGYEYYVINGRHYAVMKANIKWSLLPQKSVKINFITSDKFNTIPYSFYINLFFDAGYVSKKEIIISNKLPNSALYSTGIGIDFITYYDKVARFEFTINGKGESGLFLHFIAPI